MWNQFQVQLLCTDRTPPEAILFRMRFLREKGVETAIKLLRTHLIFGLANRVLRNTLKANECIFAQQEDFLRQSLHSLDITSNVPLA